MSMLGDCCLPSVERGGLQLLYTCDRNGIFVHVCVQECVCVTALARVTDCANLTNNPSGSVLLSAWAAVPIVSGLRSALTFGSAISAPRLLHGHHGR